MYPVSPQKLASNGQNNATKSKFVNLASKFPWLQSDLASVGWTGPAHRGSTMDWRGVVALKGVCDLQPWHLSSARIQCFWAEHCCSLHMAVVLMSWLISQFSQRFSTESQNYFSFVSCLPWYSQPHLTFTLSVTFCFVQVISLWWELVNEIHLSQSDAYQSSKPWLLYTGWTFDMSVTDRLPEQPNLLL